MATKSADNKYRYNKKFFNKTLDEWTQSAHLHNCIANGWKCAPLKIGCYGYDTLIVCFGDLLSNYSYDMTDNCIAEMMHKSWSKNYIYWRDHQPFLKNKYIKPAKPLNDSRRNKLSETSFNDLPKEEVDKNMILVDFVRQNLTNKVK